MAVTALANTYTSRAELERRFGNNGIVSHVDDLVDRADLLTNGNMDNWTSDNPNDYTVTGEFTGDREVSEVGKNEAFGGTLTGACNIYSAPSVSELITNGDFTNWTTDDPDGWTVTGESGSDPEVSEVGSGEGNGGSGTGLCNLFTSTGTLIKIEQNVATVIGKEYQITIDVDTVNSGAIFISDEDQTDFLEVYSTTGNQSFTFTASRATTEIRIARNAGASANDVTIDNISVQEVVTPILLAQTLEIDLVANNYYRLELDVTKITNGGLRVRGSHNIALLTGAVATVDLVIDETVSKIGKKIVNFRATQSASFTIQISNNHRTSALTITDVTFDSLQVFEEDNEMWQELIEEATEFINQYASWRYEEADMANSRWIRTRATQVLAYLLSCRRGNPIIGTYDDKFRDIEEELKRVEKGLLKIPRLSIRAAMTPSASNIVIDDRFITRKARVQGSTSVGDTYSDQDQAAEFPTDKF